VLLLKRIENYKNQLTEELTHSGNKKKLSLTFQEMVNNLATYGEKKELSDFFEEIQECKLTAET
jgi:hypothetical protein